MMTDPDLVSALSEAQTVALTLFGEARGEPIEGRIAVANVIRNRVRAQRPTFGLTPKAVCIKAFQFSCWLPQDGEQNYELVIAAGRELLRGQHSGPMLRECLWIADGLLTERFGDSVKAATHYLTAQLFAKQPPRWAKGQTPVAFVHKHVFFAGIK